MLANEQQSVGRLLGVGWFTSLRAQGQAHKLSKQWKREQWEKELAADGRREEGMCWYEAGCQLNVCLALDNTSSSSSPVDR